METSVWFDQDSWTICVRTFVWKERTVRNRHIQFHITMARQLERESGPPEQTSNALYTLICDSDFKR